MKENRKIEREKKKRKNIDCKKIFMRKTNG